MKKLILIFAAVISMSAAPAQAGHIWDFTIMPSTLSQEALPDNPLLKCTIQNHPQADCLEYFILPGSDSSKVDLYLKINPIWAKQYKWTYLVYKGLDLIGEITDRRVQIEGRVANMAGRYFYLLRADRNQMNENYLRAFSLEGGSPKTEELSMKCEFFK